MISFDDWVVSAGTTGYDYENMTISESLEDQVNQTIDNIKKYLEYHDCTLQDIIVFNWVITDKKYFEAAGALLKKKLQPNRPVMMTTIVHLVDDRMKFEAQILAKKGYNAL